MQLVTKKGITRTGHKENVFDAALCERIRKRLKLDKKQLSNVTIRKIIKQSNEEIGNLIVNNSEGYKLEYGFDSKKPMGVIAPSKHLPKEFREDREEKLQEIKELVMPEHYKKQILKRYGVEIDHALDYDKLSKLKVKLPHLNLDTYFYKYRIMWFNHRNCKDRKARCYTFNASRVLNKKFADLIWSGKDYYEWNFSDFYGYKVNSEW